MTGTTTALAKRISPDPDCAAGLRGVKPQGSSNFSPQARLRGP